MNVEGQYNPKDVECIPVENLEVLPSGADWQSRHLESERRKAEIRDRIHKQAEQGQKTAKDYFRPAKPTPSIYDSDLKRVAVYARVSTSSEEQISSIENQTLYYTQKIAETENWNLQDIYSDEGKSGTSLRKRDAFKRMMRDAKDQKMDLIICASISRFARNFSDCMTQIAALKTMHPAHPIGVYFETENIYTLNPSSQYSLDIQALLADWESGNKSRRMILSYDQRIMTGQYPVTDLMGYRHTKDGQLVIEPEEAKTVRFIFLAFIYGYNYDQIAAVLTQKKRSTLRGRQEWNGVMVANIMKNERRWGDLEARKSIVVDYKLGKVTKNNGNRCSAYVPEHHEAIVSPEIARAALLVASSSKKCGVQDIVVIRQGALKGFVGIHPNWNGINKGITSLEFVENIFKIMSWNRECRYKVLGRVANSDQGLCMLFDLEEAIMFTPKPQEYTDPLTGEMKKKQIKFFPDVYKGRIGKSYNDYIAGHQMNLFEDFIGYQGSVVLDEPEQKTDTISVPIPQGEGSGNTPLPNLPEQPENVQRPDSAGAERGMLT